MGSGETLFAQEPEDTALKSLIVIKLYIYICTHIPPIKLISMRTRCMSTSPPYLNYKSNVWFAFFFSFFSQVRTSVLPDHKEPRADVGVS